MLASHPFCNARQRFLLQRPPGFGADDGLVWTPSTEVEQDNRSVC